MNLATFGLVIDPRPAQSGATATIRAVGSIKPALNETAAAADKTAKALEGAGKAATAATGPARTAAGQFQKTGNEGAAAGGKIEKGMKQGASATTAMVAKVKEAGGAFDGLVGKVAKMVAGFAAFYAGVRLVSEGIQFLQESMARGAQMEDFKNSWAFLLGSFDKAKQKMAELAAYAQSTPFDLPGVNQAALGLASLTKTGLDTMEGLKMIGDAAGKANQPIQEVAERIVRLTNNLKRGGGGGDETRALAEWRVISSETAGMLMSMGQEAENFPVLLKAITADLQKASGATALMATSWNGMTAALGEGWEAFKAAIGEPINNALKPLVADLTDIVNDMTKGVQAMGPEIQRVVSYIPAAFRVLRQDGGFQLALTAGWEVLKDLMDRTWNATKIVVPAILKNAAFAFLEVLDRVNQAGFWDGMIKNLTEGLGKAVSNGLETLANPGRALGDAYMEMRNGTLNPAQVEAQNKRYAEMKAADPKRTPMKMNDGSVSYVDNDLPTEAGRALINYEKNPLLNDPPPIPDFIDAMGPKGATPNADMFMGQLLGQLDKIATDATAAAAANEKLVKEKYDVVHGGELFPKGEIVRQDNIQKDALLPGSDLPYNDAEKEADRIRENARTAEEEHNNQMERLQALRDSNFLTQDEYQRGVIKSKEVMTKAEADKAEAAKAALEKTQTGVQKLLAEWGNLAKQVDKAGVAILQNIEGNITDGIVSMIDGTKSAAQAFADMARDIVKSILQIIIKMMVQYALMSAMGMATGGLTSVAASAITGAVKHEGGSVGGEAPSRSLPAAVFGGAQRYHTGGLIGANEVPIIAERGETVLTKDQASDIKARLSGTTAQAGGRGDIHIMNVSNPQDIDARIASNPEIVLNVLASHQPTVRKILGKA